MRAKIGQYRETWRRRGYPLDLPDEAPPRLEGLCKAPSYRAICKAILKNDRALITLGFAQEQTDSYVMLKRIEIAGRK